MNSFSPVLAGATNSTVLLDKPLKYMHYGQPRSLDDGFGGFIDQRAEVALLSRNIVITGTKEAPPKQREGSFHKKLSVFQFLKLVVVLRI